MTYRALPATTQCRVVRRWLQWATVETADALAMFELRPDAYHAICDRLIDYVLGGALPGLGGN